MSRVAGESLDKLARFAASTGYDQLPSPVVTGVRLRLLDCLGNSLAARALGSGVGVLGMIREWGGREEAGLVGHPGLYPATSAAFYNGNLAHALDFDDTHLPSLIHPSASIVPAVLAMSEAVSAPGRDTVAALAVGLEVAIRVAMGGHRGAQGNAFFDRGWHATSICGTLGAAAAGAKLLGLGHDGIANSIAVASSMSSGLIEANRTGGSVKQLHCGWAAHAGLTAAQLVRHGETGPRTALDGRFGLFEAFIGETDVPGEVWADLGEDWYQGDIRFKKYPTNHFTHSGIDAVFALRQRRRKLDIRAIKSVELGVAGAPFRTIAEPRTEKVRPQSGYHGRFSGPFTVAAAFLAEGMTLDFADVSDDAVADPRYRALAEKVTVHVDSESDRLFPYQLAAVLRVTWKDGTTLEQRSTGDDAAHLPADEARALVSKFYRNASLHLATDVARELEEAANSVEDVGVSELLRLARRTSDP